MLRYSFFCGLTLWFLTTTATSGTDYCSRKLCSGRLHIACNNSGEFSSACPENQTEMVTMTPDLIKKILHSHNSKREILASGKLDGFLPATKMKLMQWDSELAEMAAFNVKTCKFGHDQCRNTDRFKYSGQNLAKLWWKNMHFTDEQIILTRIDSWWLEYKDTNMTHIYAYPRNVEKMIGHFTVMTAQDNSFVGCSGIKFPEKDMSSFTMACNYAATNIIGQAMYTCGEPGSMCLSGRSSEYPSLCL